MARRTAYIPLNTYPDVVPDAAVLGALRMAGALGCAVHVTTFAVDIPPIFSPMGDLLVDFQGLAAAAEKRSAQASAHLKSLVEGAAGTIPSLDILRHKVMPGAALDYAAAEARYFDLALLPWQANSAGDQDMALALVFESGRPVILVPADVVARPLDHIAIAWDESRVAARALGDALPLLSPDGQVSILTVQEDKALRRSDLAETLAAALELRGYRAKAVNVPRGDQAIATVLQEAALTRQAQLLVMGGFGHSRLRDFILGGATKGVFSDLRLPVLMSH